MSLLVMYGLIGLKNRMLTNDHQVEERLEQRKFRQGIGLEPVVQRRPMALLESLPVWQVSPSYVFYKLYIIFILFII